MADFVSFRQTPASYWRQVTIPPQRHHTRDQISPKFGRIGVHHHSGIKLHKNGLPIKCRHYSHGKESLWDDLATNSSLKEAWLRDRDTDMVTLGNLCVDVLVHVDNLPPTESVGKWQYMQKLMASPPDESFWEGGGMANSLIAAARLGLRCTALGHIGDDVFGRFFSRILQDHSVHIQDFAAPGAHLGGPDYHGDTLVVWVMVDPQKNHAFCSRFDFNKDPVFSKLTQLPPSAIQAIQRSKSLLMNGFIFDEVPPPGILHAAKVATEGRTPLLFDPGPRTAPLVNSSPHLREALFDLLNLCDVLLLTEDEAEVLTGQVDPTAAALTLLDQFCRRAQWVVVKRGPHGCVMAARDQTRLYTLPGFKVDVSDTVGCGDSFAAAVALGFSNFESPNATLALANAVGAATARGSGAGRNVATIEFVQEILSMLQAESDEMYLNVLEADVAGLGRRRLIIGHPTCSSGTPLHKAVDGALLMLNKSTQVLTNLSLT